MSGRADKAVTTALDLADDLYADGQYRAAEIIRRVCHGSTSRRSAAATLYRDNMALREVVTRQAQQLANLQMERAA